MSQPPIPTGGPCTNYLWGNLNKTVDLGVNQGVVKGCQADTTGIAQPLTSFWNATFGSIFEAGQDIANMLPKKP